MCCKCGESRRDEISRIVINGETVGLGNYIRGFCEEETKNSIRIVNDDVVE